MRFRLRVLFFVIALCCIALAFYSSFVEREKRLQTAIQLLQDAEANSFDPSATSRAFRYLRNIGISETKAALRRLDETGSIDPNLSRKFPFLLSSSDGALIRSKDLVYADGLLFDGLQIRHRYSISYSKLASLDLKFSELTFAAPDDLSQACEFAITEFNKRVSDLPGGDGQFALYVYFQAGQMIDHLLPKNGIVGFGETEVKPFLDSQSLQWNDAKQQYDCLDAEAPAK